MRIQVLVVNSLQLCWCWSLLSKYHLGLFSQATSCILQSPIIWTSACRNSHLVFPQQLSLLFSKLSAHKCSPRMFCPDVKRSTVQIRNQFLLLTFGYLGTGDDLVMSVIQPEVQPCLIPDLIWMWTCFSYQNDFLSITWLTQISIVITLILQL